MSLTNEQITAQNFKDFYEGIRPYLNGQVPTFANAFNRSDLYSMEERIVGSWIDGKPLYKKTTTVTLPSTSGQQDYSYLPAIPFTEIETIVKTEGHAMRVGGWTATYLENTNQSNYKMLIAVDWNPTSHKIWINISDDVAGQTATLTFYYTKTGDTPIKVGTGNDYSTDEQIVGSWIDGKPLYQKTFAKTMPTFSSGEGVLKITEAVSNDYDVMVEMFGIIQISQNDYANIGGFSNNTTEDRMWFGDFSGTICLGVISSITNRSGKPVYITLRYTKTTD